MTRSWTSVWQVWGLRFVWRLRALSGRLNGWALAWVARRTEAGPLPRHPRKVLVVRLDEIGDALLGLPSLRRLRARWPKAEIQVVCKPAVASLYAAVPEVDAAIPYTPLQSKNMGAYASWRAARAFAKERLASWRPDVCLNPRWGFDLTGSAWLALYSGAACRVAWTEKATLRKSRLNLGYDRAYTLVLGATRPMHQVEQGLRMASALGAAGGPTKPPVLSIPGTDREWARKTLKGTAWLAFAPGASHPKKCWPKERFGVLARNASLRWRLKPVVLGSKADWAAGQSILNLAGVPGLNLCGETDLLRSLAVVGRCRALVGNDSGPVHMAAAMGFPGVVVSSFAADSDPGADNAPARFHPWGAPFRLLQAPHQASPCRGECEAYSPHCILGVGVGDVEIALGDLLAFSRSSPFQAPKGLLK